MTLGFSSLEAFADDDTLDEDSWRMYYVQDQYSQAQVAEAKSDAEEAARSASKAAARVPAPAGMPAMADAPAAPPPSGGMPGMPGMGGSTGPAHKCTPQGALLESLQEALIVLILYLIVAVGKWVHDREALETLRRGDFWVWVVLLVTVGTFLKYFSPKIRDSVLNAAVFNVILLMMQPIKRMAAM
jgi:hypothetical protein